MKQTSPKCFYLLTYLLTYLLHGTFLFEKLIGFQLAEKFADKCGRFVLQQIRSVRYDMIACATVCKKRTLL